MRSSQEFHRSVLLKEALQYLDVQSGKTYIDATIGGGGHAAAILEKGGCVLGIDSDPDAVRYARVRLERSFGAATAKFRVVRGNFKNILEIARKNGFATVRGVLYDLGMSSWQIESSGRGFSFLRDEPLDMRMDPSLSVTARDLLAALTVKELDELFKKFAEEKHSRAIAHAIASSRELRPLRTTRELAGLLAWIEEGRCGEFWDWYERKFLKDPNAFGSFDLRARVFQALRIVVNDELNNLRLSLPRAARLLEPQGRLVALTFHSLEEKVVKEFGNLFQSSDEDGRPRMQLLTERPVRPTAEEVARNPRARSAKLYAWERLV